MSGSALLDRRATRALAALLLALALSLAAMAGPEPGPLAAPAHALGATSGNAGGAKVAVNDRGDAIAAWYRTIDDLYQVEARYRPAGGSWGPIKVLSSNSQFSYPPTVGIDDAGGSAVIWSRRIDGIDRIQAARRTAGGAWSTKTLTPAGTGAGSPDLVMDAKGNVTAAWELFTNPTSIHVARKPVGKGWSAATRITPDGVYSQSPQLAASPGGTVMLTWSTPGSEGRIKAVRRPPTGPWSKIMNVSPTGNPGGQSVALDAKARATVAWRGVANNVTVIFTRRHTANGWGAIQQLPATGQQVSTLPEVEVTSSGDAYVVWVGPKYGVNSSLLARRPVKGSWSNPVLLSSVRRTSDAVALSVNRRGDAAVAWYSFDVTGSWVEASFRPRGGGFGLATVLTDPEGAASISDVGVGGDRSVHVVMALRENAIFRIFTVRRTPKGTWTSPQVLSGLP